MANGLIFSPQDEHSRQSRGWRSERHKELSETGTDQQIGVEQAIVAQKVADKTGDTQPEPGLHTRLNGKEMSGTDQQSDTQQNDRHTQPDNIEGQGSDTFAPVFKAKGCNGP